MSKWSPVKLGKIVESGGGIIHTGPFGSQLHASDYVESGIPCVMPANMKGNRVDLSGVSFISQHDATRLSKYLVQKGDILYSRRGDVTLKALIRSQEVGYFCGTGCLLLRPGNKINSEFLTYYLSTSVIQEWISSQAVGATMPNLNTGILARVPFAAPDKNTQQTIAAVLSALDAKIDCNNRINAELEAMAKTLYEYWFVQFDFPISKAQAQAMGNPALEGKPYKSSGGKMEYNKVLKREIPEGWRDRPLRKFLTCNAKKLGSKHDLDFINYLDTANLTNNRIEEIQQLQLDFDQIPSRANMVISKNDILYSTVRPNQYHYGLIRNPVRNMIASTGFAVLSFERNANLNSVFYLFLTSETQTEKLIKISESSKSSYPSISPDDILNLRCAFPVELDLIEQAASIMNPIFDKISTLQKESKELSQLRDWLLPMLMNGQVTVA